MIEIRIVIEQQKDGQMCVTHSTPSGYATEQEAHTYRMLMHANEAMLTIMGGSVKHVTVTPEMQVDPKKN